MPTSKFVVKLGRSPLSSSLLTLVHSPVNSTFLEDVAALRASSDGEQPGTKPATGLVLLLLLLLGPLLVFVAAFLASGSCTRGGLMVGSWKSEMESRSSPMKKDGLKEPLLEPLRGEALRGLLGLLELSSLVELPLGAMSKFIAAAGSTSFGGTTTLAKEAPRTLLLAFATVVALVAPTRLLHEPAGAFTGTGWSSRATAILLCTSAARSSTEANISSLESTAP
mmetsp:Transcript_9216/g.33794  ORF Transcript_9216/g.33794 Transcript_9216/m.33794 type:complete len:224 (-) Transcript_9216:1667-2338(-)